MSCYSVFHFPSISPQHGNVWNQQNGIFHTVAFPCSGSSGSFQEASGGGSSAEVPHANVFPFGPSGPFHVDCHPVVPFNQQFTHPGFYRVRGPPPAAFCSAPAVTLESRIYEMNKRLQHRSEDPDGASLWWDAFGNEFFDDEAQLTLRFTLEDGPKRYTIGRTLIPRYFRSIFDGGVKDLYYVLRYPTREFVPAPGVLILECEKALMVTRHEKPNFTEVYTEGRLICEFSCEDPYFPKVRLWMMEIQTHQEFIPRGALSVSAPDPPAYHDQLSKNITRQGMTSVTLNYLRPMQQLMSQFKAYNVPPRECLRTTLFQRYHSNQVSGPQQRPGPPPPPMTQPIPIPTEEGTTRPPKRKRNRKGSQSGGTTPTGTGGGKKKNAVSPAPATTSFALTSHVDVMVVGEPSLMGGEYGEEDERMISRMENTQYDPTVVGGPASLAPNAGGIPPMSADVQGGPFDAGIGWPPSGPSSLQGPGSRTPQTPVSRTATPSATTAVASPVSQALNGQRTVKTENPDNGRGSTSSVS